MLVDRRTETLEYRQLTMIGEVHVYALRRSARRTLGITVEPTGSIVVTAPASASVAQIERAMCRRSEWIWRRVREAALMPPPPVPREWISGETHRYLGRQYRLKVRRAAVGEVRLSGAFFRVATADPSDTAAVRRQMERWYLDRAQATFARRMGNLVGATPRLRLGQAPPLLVRRLRQRWGSCSPEGRILMNVEAVQLPVGCIDYLLMHELCHLRVPHHGTSFWQLLDACMPDWERWRKRLERTEA